MSNTLRRRLRRRAGVLRTLYGITDAVWIGRLGAVELEAMGAVSFGSWVVLILGEVEPRGATN